MSIHAADAETIVDGLATLGEVIVGDGVLVTELFLGLLDLAALLNIGKLVLFRLGLAGTDASVLGRHVWSMLDVGLIGVWLGGDGDIIVGVVVAQAVAGCDGERVRFSGVVCADAVRSVLGVGVGEVVAGNNRHGLLLLLELNLQLIQFVELLLRKGLLRSLRLTIMPGAQRLLLLLQVLVNLVDVILHPDRQQHWHFAFGRDTVPSDLRHLGGGTHGGVFRGKRSHCCLTLNHTPFIH